mmetsp:Transcript_24486/g.68104  ORF Transcript_24486/g.68104 Transcript_24486/m.68104 type:complete len:308 (-) Transcript_24486:478-1401(-)
MGFPPASSSSSSCSPSSSSTSSSMVGKHSSNCSSASSPSEMSTPRRRLFTSSRDAARVPSLAHLSTGLSTCRCGTASSLHRQTASSFAALRRICRALRCRMACPAGRDDSAGFGIDPGGTWYTFREGWEEGTGLALGLGAPQGLGLPLPAAAAASFGAFKLLADAGPDGEERGNTAGRATELKLTVMAGRGLALGGDMPAGEGPGTERRADSERLAAGDLHNPLPPVPLLLSSEMRRALYDVVAPVEGDNGRRLLAWNLSCCMAATGAVVCGLAAAAGGNGSDRPVEGPRGAAGTPLCTPAAVFTCR